MNERITYNPEKERRDRYRKRLVEAINYKGDNDHEDVPSILCEFREEIIKEHTDKIVKRLEEELNPDKECFDFEDDHIYADERHKKYIEIVKGGAE